MIDFDRDDDRLLLCLGIYAEYLVYKRNFSDNEACMSDGTKAQSLSSLSLLAQHAEAVYSRFSNDSVVCYLYGIVMLSSAEGADQAFGVDLLFASIKFCEHNWASWAELSSRSGVSKRVDTDFTQAQFYKFFKIEKYLKSNQPQKALSLLLKVQSSLPNWEYVLERVGIAHHNLRQFGDALNAFKTLASRNKFCVDSMDLYSNCLFLMEQQTELFELATFWLNTSPNRYETNVIAGNYFSLKSDHEKAALFFKRATAANPSDMNSWLLLGHELIELRNPSGALAAYQTAAKLPSAKWDVRSWYSMGQLFELMNQHAFAVYYHTKAVEIDSKDVRIWKALGNCFTKLNRSDEALKCHEKVRFLSIG